MPDLFHINVADLAAGEILGCLNYNSGKCSWFPYSTSVSAHDAFRSIGREESYF